MRRGRFRSFARGRRRSVTWIDGLNTKDDVTASESRLITLAQFAGTNTWAAAILLTTDADLGFVGGEDAVLTRIRGSLMPFTFRRNAGAGNLSESHLLRIVVCQTDVELPAATISPFNFNTASGLGQDDILWMTETIAAGTTLLGQTGANIEFETLELSRREVDVKAKRKLQRDRQIAIWFQAMLPVGTTAADFRLTGFLRVLLKHPR